MLKRITIIIVVILSKNTLKSLLVNSMILIPFDHFFILLQPDSSEFLEKVNLYFKDSLI